MVLGFRNAPAREKPGNTITWVDGRRAVLVFEDDELYPFVTDAQPRAAATAAADTANACHTTECSGCAGATPDPVPAPPSPGTSTLEPWGLYPRQMFARMVLAALAMVVVWLVTLKVLPRAIRKIAFAALVAWVLPLPIRTASTRTLRATLRTPLLGAVALARALGVEA